MTLKGDEEKEPVWRRQLQVTEGEKKAGDLVSVPKQTFL